MAIQNGTPMGPGFFIFFNNLDVCPPKGFTGFRRIHEFEDLRTDDEDVLELISIILTSRLLDG